jgi:hypothetical protein
MRATPTGTGRLARIRRVFFASPFDSAVTLILLAATAWIAPPLLRWALFDATWIGEAKSACAGGGACWAIVTARWRQVIAGFFPEGHLWRVALAATLLGASLAPIFSRRIGHWTPVLAPLGVVLAFGVLGFGPVRSTILIILPQALRIATPALVNSFIGLFKDTTLIYVIGILDITGVLRNAVTDYAWQGLEVEVYVCVALVFWAFCFALSRLSLVIERRSTTP